MKIRWICLAVAFVCGVTLIHAQKKLVNDEIYKIWEEVVKYNYGITHNGKYIFYQIDSICAEGNHRTLVINEGTKEIFRCKSRVDAAFTDDSRYLVAPIPGDRLLLYDLAKKRPFYIANADNYSIKLAQPGKRPIVVYRFQNRAFILDVPANKTYTYDSVEDVVLNVSGTAAVLHKPGSVVWVDLPANKTTEIFRGNARYLQFDNPGKQICFIEERPEGRQIWLYRAGMKAPEVRVARGLPDDSLYFVADAGPVFSPDGTQVYFKVNKKAIKRDRDELYLESNLSVWHYKDPHLQSHQLQLLPSINDIKYTWVVGTQGSIKPIQLENDSLEIVDNGGNQFVILQTSTRWQESYWNESQKPRFTLVSLNDGSAKPLLSITNTMDSPSLSPEEKFVMWTNRGNGDTYCYEIASATTKNITCDIRVPADIKDIVWGSIAYRITGNIHWMERDEAVILEDKYDIWQVDTRGVKKPINLTAGYGRQHNIKFVPAEEKYAQYRDGATLILRAMDKTNGENGFWKTVLGKSSAPIKGNMQPYCYSWPMNDQLPFLRRAKNAEVYLIMRQSAEEAPNLFATMDLKDFTSLSDCRPQKNYNWMTSELISWKKNDGETAQGILYKPENFDSSIKYPVIFHYYQERSYELHQFRKPQVEPNQIDIPWYVSNGYLVFIPDIINDKPGKIAETVISTAESAVKYLSAFPWVNTKKIGAQGHSFGGYETNLLVAYSTLFAAAQASAAASDLVSKIGGTAFSESEEYSFHETGQTNLGIGILPWTDPEVYVKNSPVFYAGKVTTPLLLIHGRYDRAVKFSQAVEFFTALRRCQKSVWLLDYGEGHIFDGNNAAGRDAALRQRQFFEHYLKDKPAPLWMVEGVPAKYRSIKSGLQLDSLNRIP